MTERVWFEFEGNVDFVRGNFEYVADVKAAIHRKLGHALSQTPVNLHLFLPPLNTGDDGCCDEPVELRGDMLCRANGVDLMNLTPSNREQPRHLLVVAARQRSRPNSPGRALQQQFDGDDNGNGFSSPAAASAIPQLRSTTPVQNSRPASYSANQMAPQPPSSVYHGHRVFLVGDDTSGLVRDSDEQQQMQQQQLQSSNVHYGQPHNPRAAMFARVSQERSQQMVAQQQPATDPKIRVAVDVVAAYRQDVVLGTLHLDMAASLLRPVAFSSSNSASMVMTPAARKNADAARVRQILDLCKNIVTRHVVVIETPSVPPQLVRVMAYDAEFSEFVLLTESSNVHIAQSFNAVSGAMSRALIAVVDYPTPAEFPMAPEARGGFIVSQPGFRKDATPEREQQTQPSSSRAQPLSISPQRGRSPDHQLRVTAPSGSQIPFVPPPTPSPQMNTAAATTTTAANMHPASVYQQSQHQRGFYVSPRHLGAGGASPSAVLSATSPRPQSQQQQQQQQHEHQQVVTLHPTHESVLTKLELTIAQLQDERHRRIVAERVIAEREASIAEQILHARRESADAARQAQNARLDYINAQFLATTSQLEEAKMRISQLTRGEGGSDAPGGATGIRVQQQQQLALEAQDLRRCRAENEAELDALRSKRDMLQGQLDRAADNHDRMVLELDAVRLQVSHLVLDKTKLMQDLEEERRRKFSPEAQAAVEQQIVDLRATNGSLAAKAARLEKDLSAANLAQQTALNQNGALQQDLDMFRRDWGRDTTAKAQRIAELEGKLAAMGGAGDHIGEELLAARAATDKAREERDQAQRKLHEATTDLAGRKSKVAQLETLVDDLKKKIAARSNNNNNPASQSFQTPSRNQTAAQPNKEEDELNFGSSDEEKSINNNNDYNNGGEAAAAAATTTTTVALDAIRRDLQNCQRELTEAKVENRKLQDQLSDTSGAKDREIARLREDVASEHGSLASLERKNEELMQRLQNAVKADAAEDVGHAKAMAALRKQHNALQLERDDLKLKLDDLERNLVLSKTRSAVFGDSPLQSSPRPPQAGAGAADETTITVSPSSNNNNNNNNNNNGASPALLGSHPQRSLSFVLVEQKKREAQLQEQLDRELEENERLRRQLKDMGVAVKERDEYKKRLASAQVDLHVEWARGAKVASAASSTDVLTESQRRSEGEDRQEELLEMMKKRDAENSALRAQLSEATSSAADAQSERDLLAAKHEQAHTRGEDLSRQLNELSESFASIRQRLQQRNDALSSELHDARQAIQTLRDEKIEMERELENERAMHDNTRRDFSQSVRRAATTPDGGGGGSGGNETRLVGDLHAAQRDVREKEETIARNQVEEGESLAFRVLQKQKEEALVQDFFSRSGGLMSSSNNNGMRRPSAVALATADNAVMIEAATAAAAAAAQEPKKTGGFTVVTTSTTTKPSSSTAAAAAAAAGVSKTLKPLSGENSDFGFTDSDTDQQQQQQQQPQQTGGSKAATAVTHRRGSAAADPSLHFSPEVSDVAGNNGRTVVASQVPPRNAAAVAAADPTLYFSPEASAIGGQTSAAVFASQVAASTAASADPSFQFSDASDEPAGAVVASPAVSAAAAAGGAGADDVADRSESNVSFGVSESDNDSSTAAAAAAAKVAAVVTTATAAQGQALSPPMSDFGVSDSDADATGAADVATLATAGAASSAAAAGSSTAVTTTTTTTTTLTATALLTTGAAAAKVAASSVPVPDPPARMSPVPAGLSLAPSTPSRPAARPAEEQALDFDEDVNERTLPPSAAGVVVTAATTTTITAASNKKKEEESDLEFDDDTFSFDSGNKSSVKSAPIAPSVPVSAQQQQQQTSVAPAAKPPVAPPQPPAKTPTALPPVAVEGAAAAESDDELNFSTDTGDNIKPSPPPSKTAVVAAAAAAAGKPISISSGTASTNSFNVAAKSAMGNVPAPPKSFQMANADSSDDDFSFGSSNESSPTSKEL